MRMIPHHQTAQHEKDRHKRTDHHKRRLPIPGENEPGNDRRENERPDTIASHGEAHRHAARLFKPAGYQRRSGHEKRTASKCRHDTVPESKSLHGEGGAGHVDAKTVHERAAEYNETEAVRVHQRSHQEYPDAAHNRGQRIGEREGAMGPPHAVGQGVMKTPKAIMVPEATMVVRKHAASIIQP